MSVAVPPREVTLSARGERVVFDYRDGLYRVAYYRRKLDPVSKRYVDGEDRCRKLTWLYYVGETPPPGLIWRFLDPGGRVHDDGGGGRDQRSKTPPAFRDVLLTMARSARVGVEA